jgi:hypothetical protein
MDDQHRCNEGTLCKADNTVVRAVFMNVRSQSCDNSMEEGYRLLLAVNEVLVCFLVVREKPEIAYFWSRRTNNCTCIETDSQYVHQSLNVLQRKKALQWALAVGYSHLHSNRMCGFLQGHCEGPLCSL